LQINPLAFPTFFLTAVFFRIGRHIFPELRSSPTRSAFLALSFFFAVPGLMYVAYYVHLFDSAAWFYNFRAARFTELVASGMGLLFGYLYSWMEPDTLGEKVFAPVILSILVFIPFMKPLLAPIDLSRLKSECPDNICLQSTESSCGPASAATILKAYGIRSSEQELAKDAFTYRGGTENWYLARALTKRGFDVRVMQIKMPDQLPTPSIAGVLLGGGAGHFIAVLSSDKDIVTVVDPLIGKLVMSHAQLLRKYHFTGFFLVVSRKTT
jgi:predicted double-glycine peptidase